jgi:hypothetical protein
LKTDPSILKLLHDDDVLLVIGCIREALEYAKNEGEFQTLTGLEPNYALEVMATFVAEFDSRRATAAK